jgi:hypothetical protein
LTATSVALLLVAASRPLVAAVRAKAAVQPLVAAVRAKAAVQPLVAAVRAEAEPVATRDWWTGPRHRGVQSANERPADRPARTAQRATPVLGRSGEAQPRPEELAGLRGQLAPPVPPASWTRSVLSLPRLFR